MINNKIKKIIQIIIYLLVFYFIFKIIYKNWLEIKQAIEHINYFWLLLSLIITTLVLTFQGYIWHRLLKYFQPKLTFRESYVSYFRSIITRYLPGGIWAFFARTYLTAKLGIDKAQVLFLIVVESAIATLSGSFVFLIVQPKTDYTFYINILLIFLIIVILLFLALPKFFIKIYKLIFNKDLAVAPLPVSLLSLIVLLNMIQWFVNGFAFIFLAKAFTIFNFSQFMPLVGIYAASWIIGFIILVAPSGLGIRESIFIILLTPLLGLPLATIISLLSRIIFIFGELINFFITIFNNKTLDDKLKEKS